MSKTITAQRMSKLLDNWVSHSDPFNSDVRPTFGLTDEQRGESIVVAATTFADFRMLGSRRPKGSGVPFVTLFGQASEHLQFLQDSHPECFSLWYELGSHCNHHLVRAMLNDLLWTVRFEGQVRPFEYARTAIEEYLAFFDEVAIREIEHKSMHMCDLLSRAIELAGEVNAGKEYYPKVAERCSDWLEDLSSQESYWAISAAACLPAQFRPPVLSDRIEALHASYAAADGDRWTLIESLYALELTMAERDKDRDRERQIRVRASRMFIKEAKGTESDLKAGRFLQEAEKWAKGANEESVLIKEIREIRGGLAYDDEFHEVSVDQSVPNDEIEKITKTVRSAETMSEAFAITTACGWKALGSIDLIEEAVQSAHDEPRLIDLVSRVHIVHDGIECCRPTSDEAKLRRTIAEHYRLQATLTADLVIGPCLATIEERPEAERDVLREILADATVIGDFEADRFARAFDLYWEQDYDTAVHIALPSVESTIRMLARNAGVEISYPPQGDECGGLRGLKPILVDLHGVIGEANARMLAYLLVDNHAMNLRDSYAHGVRSPDPQVDAALVLWMILWLANLRYEQSQADA